MGKVVKELFGTLKTTKPTQKIKNELRKGWGRMPEFLYLVDKHDNVLGKWLQLYCQGF